MIDALSSPERVTLVDCSTMCIFLHYNVQSLTEQYGTTHSCTTTCKEVKLRPWLWAPPRAEFMRGNLGIDVWHDLDLVKPS